MCQMLASEKSTLSDWNFRGGTGRVILVAEHLSDESKALRKSKGTIMLFAWMFLLLAIMTEVAGTSSINKIIENGSLASYLPMWLGISVSYFFLSKAIKRIPIGIAYALWEGVGVTLITLVSVFYFGYDLSLQEMVGLGLAVTGIVMVNAGESHPEQAEEGA